MKKWWVGAIVVTAAGIGLAQQGSSAQQSQNGSENKPKPEIRVCVAPMENLASRSVSPVLQRNRLMHDLDGKKGGKHDDDRRPIKAVALESTSSDTLGVEARQKQCDFIVLTTLRDLRDPGDMPSATRPGEIPIGQDPMANIPGVGERHDVARRATVAFQIKRMDRPQPIVDTAIDDQQNMDDEALVSQMMDRIAVRVNDVVRQKPEPGFE